MNASLVQPAQLASPAPPFPFQENDRPIFDLDVLPRSVAERLAGAGLGTTHTLHEASTVDIVGATGAPVDVIRTWKAMAELLDLPVLDPRQAHDLSRAGIESVPQLAAADAEALQARLVALETPTAEGIAGAEGLKTIRRWIQFAGRHPASASTPVPTTHVATERVVLISTARYWVAVGLSLLFLGLAVGSYRDYLPGGSIVLLWITTALALIVITWSIVGLSRRGRIVHRTVHGTRSMVRSVGESVRNRSEASEGAMGRLASKWAQRFTRLVRAVVWLVTLPIRIVTWAWYTSETLVWRVVLVAYDIVYYPTLAAWLVLHWAVRTSIRIVWWALGVVWKILKPLTRLPVAKTMWRRKYRPAILARYRAFHERRAHNLAMKIEKGRRLAEMHHRDPNRWEEHYRATHGFPLPHPEHGRVRIRKRISQIKREQRARRERRKPRRVPARPGAPRALPGGSNPNPPPQNERLAAILRGRPPQDEAPPNNAGADA